MEKMTCCLLILAVIGFAAIARGDDHKESNPATVDNPTKPANGVESANGVEPASGLKPIVEVTIKDVQLQLAFLVRDDKGNYINDLAASDFQVFENGKSCPVVSLEEEEVPINAVVMVDTSVSLGTHLANEIRTAVGFFRSLENESSAFLLFSETPRLILNWDDPEEDLSALLKETRPAGRTALHDSVIWACANLLKNRAGKKLIVLLTDGIDTVSSASFEEMIRATHQHGVVLYPIFYTNQYIERFRKMTTEGDLLENPKISKHFYDMLTRQNGFTKQTLRWGGRAIFSEHFADLTNIYADIVREMKSQYMLLYDSGNGEPQDERDINIIAKNGSGKVVVNPFLILP